MKMRSWIVLAAALAVTSAAAFADDKDDEKKAETPADKATPQVRTTKHSGTFGGQRVDFRATIAETILKSDDGTPVVLLGTTAGGLILLDQPTLRTALLLAVTVWAFARAYYFAFYVIERYVDPGFKFAGLSSFLVYLLRKRTSPSFFFIFSARLHLPPPRP